MKTCDRCNVKMDLTEFERHFACIEVLLKNIEEIQKKNECQKKSFKELHAKHVKILQENKVNASSVKSLNISLNRSNEMIRQLQLANDDKAAQLHQLQYHNHTGGAQNSFLAAENEKLQKNLKDMSIQMTKLKNEHHVTTYSMKEENRMLRNTVNENVATHKRGQEFLAAENDKFKNSVKDLNARISKLQRDHHSASFNTKEENRILQNKANETAAQLKKTKDTLQNQSNRIKKMEAEAKKSNEQKKNTTAAKKKADESLKKLQTEMKELRSNYDHLSDLFCQGNDTDNCKSCKSGAILSLLPQTQIDQEKIFNEKIKNLENLLANATRTVEQQREQHKQAKKELEERITQSYACKIAGLEAALKNKVNPSADSLEKVSSENSTLQYEILELQKQLESCEKGGNKNSSRRKLKSPVHTIFYFKEQEYLKEVEKSQYKQLYDEQQEKEKLLAEANMKVKVEILSFLFFS